MRTKTTKFEDDWRLYARSASDDKSPIVALCAAIDALKASGLTPTSNVHVILDGEEEASSPSLVPAIARYRDRLRADLMIILDGPGHSSGRPTVAFGARGIVTFDLTVFGPRAGVHSGNYGNWIPNPAMRLAALLASMKADDGRVAVAGFYDGVVPPGPPERAILDAVPEDSERMLGTFGVAAPERAFPKLQDALQSPTLNVRGLVSSHVGAGARTIIPDRATAAMDIRLVKETRADDLLDKVRAHIRRQGYHLVDGEPDDATRAAHSKIARLDAGEAVMHAFRTSPTDPGARAVVAAIERTYGAAARPAPDAGWRGPDRRLHRCARLPGGPRAGRELRQQPARGKRERAARQPVRCDRHAGGGAANVNRGFHGVPPGSPRFRRVLFRGVRGIQGSQGSGLQGSAAPPNPVEPEPRTQNPEPSGTSLNRTLRNPAEPCGTQWNPDSCARLI